MGSPTQALLHRCHVCSFQYVWQVSRRSSSCAVTLSPPPRARPDHSPSPRCLPGSPQVHAGEPVALTLHVVAWHQRQIVFVLRSFFASPVHVAQGMGLLHPGIREVCRLWLSYFIKGNPGTQVHGAIEQCLFGIWCTHRINGKSIVYVVNQASDDICVQ